MEQLERIEEPGAKWQAARRKSPHQQQVEAFMIGAGQTLPVVARLPSDEIRELRARLIFEEAMETINALGVKILVRSRAELGIERGETCEITVNTPATRETPEDVAEHRFEVLPAESVTESPEEMLVAIADGCCDVAVVTTGTLSACGLADELLQHEVNCNNLLKFAEGHRIDPGGKLIKPADHSPPRLLPIIKAQRTKG